MEKRSFTLTRSLTFSQLIKVNALQVAPAELEAALLEHNDIEDAAVTGIKLFDEEWPRAYVQLRDQAKARVTTKDIQDWIAARMAKHKHLAGGVVFVDEVPKVRPDDVLFTRDFDGREFKLTLIPACERQDST